MKIGFLPLLFLVLLVLKATGTVDWSWWWVFSPLIAGAAVLMVVLLCLVMIINYKGR